MDKETFIEGLNRLKNQYGEKFYGPDRVRVILEATRELNNTQWLKVVDSLIGEFRQAPLITDIRNVTRPFLIDPLQKKENVCRPCDTTGFIYHFEKKISAWGYEVKERSVSPCPNCERGKQIAAGLRG